MRLRLTAMLFGFAAAVTAPGLVSAQSGEALTSTGGVQAVLACQSVRGDKAQLACFRRAAKLLTQEPAPTQSAEAPPPRLFGAPPPRLRHDRPADDRDATLVVRSIGDLGDGRAILNLADGSSWVETEAEPITSAVKAGDSVRLEKGALGGYLLVLPHRSAIRIRRLRTE
ncbi:MAG TPA: hypothetical protein VK801_01610 [Caulobacteraceae bacterium]|jgi:hypothetical protein|nr:hypothetical protein [Caulobacteraceae bacterium]